MNKYLSAILTFATAFCLASCSGTAASFSSADSTSSHIVTDSMNRSVELPTHVSSVVCVGVGALRYTTYMEGADLVTGVEDYETTPGMSRLYNYVNFDTFKDLPVIGTNGEPYVEELIQVNPDVIVMSEYAAQDPDELTSKTGIPVVMIPGSDTTLDEKAFTTIQILGEVFDKQERANNLSEYLHSLAADLEIRTVDIPDEEKPTVYVGGVSFKGHHGVEGTEAHYGPFELIHANNLADSTGQDGAFNIDVEQILQWDPDLIFLDFNGFSLIHDQYAEDPSFYDSLRAVQEGNIYSQISFRSSAANLETALADAYYAGTVIYPDHFADIDPAEKAGEIFTELLGSNPYPDLKEAGYEFRKITFGE